MADFTLIIGVSHTVVPKAFLKGNPSNFPTGTKFLWESDDPTLGISDPNAQSPTITPTADVTGASLTLTVTKPDGVTQFTKTHTIDVVEAQPDFDEIDFDIQ